MVELKRLTETPGNCFSCGWLNEWRTLPQGMTRCGFDKAEWFSDTNRPHEVNCQHWKQKVSQKVLSVNGQFAGLQNNYV